MVSISTPLEHTQLQLMSPLLKENLLHFLVTVRFDFLQKKRRMNEKKREKKREEKNEPTLEKRLKL